jgi:hypothetical protein
MAALLLLAACSENSPNMTENNQLRSAAPSTGNAHFLKNFSSCSVSSTAVLTCSFKETGLSSGSVETIRIQATVTAVFFCFNGGEKHPKAANKETVSGVVSNVGEFGADDNGSVQGEISVGPPSAGSFSCPPGQELRLESATYSSVNLFDFDSQASLNIAGNFST